MIRSDEMLKNLLNHFNLQNYNKKIVCRVTTQHNPLKLTMLGVKTTCKDRWRQVLAEANRIEHKHLLTFEAAISTNQTDEMHTKNLQLVVPRRLHESYTENQRTWLMDVSSFISLVQERQ